MPETYLPEKISHAKAQRRKALPRLARALLFIFAVAGRLFPRFTHRTAQPQPTPLTAPPPFKMIVKEERAQIGADERFAKTTQAHDRIRCAHTSLAPNNTRRAQIMKQLQRKSACITR